VGALISAKSIWLTYDGMRRAVHDLTFEVEAGSIFALVGPNGAGKTSTLRMLATLVEPLGGSLLLDGIDVQSAREIARRRVGYLPDHFSIYENLTPVEYLDFFGRCFGLDEVTRRRRTDELLDEFELGSKRNSPSGSLSRGMRQRLGLAKTLVHEPKVVLLDEPASALDPSARFKLRETLGRLKARGCAIVISSHILPDLAGLADSIGIMESGRMIRCGTVDGVLNDAQGERQVYCLEAASHPERMQRAIEEFGPRIVHFEVRGSARFEVELTGGRETVAALIEAIVLRGGRVAHVAPRESAIEAAYRVSAAAEVA
jgi:ABC-2 type transport system ATP-binding protein